MAERWTKQRRLEHTRNVLLDAAEEVFARKGFEGAALEDIAEVGGYTRGAIYSHFGSKAELFLAVVERQREQFLDGFADVIATFHRLEDLDADELGDRWRDLVAAEGPDRAVLGSEYTLFLLRNPDARERVAAQREETVRALADYISKGAARLGGHVSIPAVDLARVILAANDGVTLNSLLDGQAVYRPFLRMVLANIVVPKGNNL
ncbi:TetR/AcrR family transcriptional regulator [Mycolicibacterium fortuitum]|uniref:Transcriptional regulator n=3 Tax=Mycolicibacterium fortuitum TaxID=1766 RepID=A0A0N9YBP2_MYCFO|nr:TetR family transcriptional regulator [Mycolicibacterium fortuitum]AIY46665.1 Transcriptional regulator, TetR family [Mycobacterium sp. VKM Ac-1817D]CRL79474.1 transcriptional regulator [Mycolicibacter nonchromogenicus]ALI26958.1 Transcriptional regulator, TetR family [Mycolicibacterium fortuitum]EJZ11207.1 transcriptional regulator [Mycolicibacterium fortuitum subsp. fortuitum DSM 46621 = ATCC 6841 = JCM 6387]MCV7138044.1 TetR/AcrR family transcriptional regulator [Mycolicibacterium fortui